MGSKTKIEWCDRTFNPWIGCAKVSPGCAHCYAELQNKLPVRCRWGRGEARYRSSDAYLAAPERWNELSRKRVAKGERRLRVFSASNADILDDEVDRSWHAHLWETVERAPHLDWLLLTKRPENARALLPSAWIEGEWPMNAWFGVSVENQECAETRLPLLCDLPAPIRFVSAEPLLGPVDLTRWLSKLGWVIVGGESGARARPMHPRWVRSIRDQCQAAGVPFFFKQHGQFRYGEAVASKSGVPRFVPPLPVAGGCRATCFPKGSDEPVRIESSDQFHALATIGAVVGVAVGKDACDHNLLDGVRHQAWPKSLIPDRLKEAT